MLTITLFPTICSILASQAHPLPHDTSLIHSIGPHVLHNLTKMSERAPVHTLPRADIRSTQSDFDQLNQTSIRTSGSYKITKTLHIWIVVLCFENFIIFRVARSRMTTP